MVTIEYASNNSRGQWPLDDDDWKKLEKAGWLVHWEWLDVQWSPEGQYTIKDGLPVLIHNDELGPGSRFLGALARYAWRRASSLEEARAEWEEITDQCPDEVSCDSPCGPLYPLHRFSIVST